MSTRVEINKELIGKFFTTPMFVGVYEIIDVNTCDNHGTVKSVKTGETIELSLLFLNNAAVKFIDRDDQVLEKVSQEVAGIVMDVSKALNYLSEGKQIKAYTVLMDIFEGNKNLLAETGNMSQEVLAKSLLDSWQKNGDFIPKLK